MYIHIYIYIYIFSGKERDNVFYAALSIDMMP